MTSTMEWRELDANRVKINKFKYFIINNFFLTHSRMCTLKKNKIERRKY